MTFTNEQVAFEGGCTAFDAGEEFDATQTKEWQDGWSASQANRQATDEDNAIEYAAFRRIYRLKRYGSRRTKVLIRRHDSLALSQSSIVAIVCSARS